MTEETKPPTIPTYSDKITELLNKVSKGEKIYPDVAPIPAFHKAIQEQGVQKVITSVFTEDYKEVPAFLKEEDSEDGIDGTTYKFVSPPSSYADVDAYWNNLSGQLQHLGKIVSNKPGCIETKVLSAKTTEETLRICLVRDEQNADRPSLAFIHINGEPITPIELSNYMNKVGLKLDRPSAKQSGAWIIADITK